MPPSSDYSPDEASNSVHRFSIDRPEAGIEKSAQSLEMVTYVLLVTRPTLEKPCHVCFFVDALMLTIKHGTES